MAITLSRFVNFTGKLQCEIFSYVLIQIIVFSCVIVQH